MIRRYGHKPDDLERVSAATAGTEANLVQWLALTMALRWQIAELAVQHMLPSVYERTFSCSAISPINSTFAWASRMRIRTSLPAAIAEAIDSVCRCSVSLSSPLRPAFSSSNPTITRKWSKQTSNK